LITLLNGHTIKVWVDATATTTTPVTFVSYNDYDLTTLESPLVDVSNQITSTNGTTQVTALSTPSSSHKRQMKGFTLCNVDTVDHTVVVYFDNGVTEVRLARAILPPDYELQFSDMHGWVVRNENGEVSVVGGTGATGADGVTRYILCFGGTAKVPVGGTLWLKNGDVFSSAAPVKLSANARLERISISTDSSDGSRDFEAQILKNGSLADSLPLPSGSVGEYSVLGSPVGYGAGDLVSARIVRTSGSGASTFANINVTAVFSET
jgi:hypothetical protein